MDAEHRTGMKTLACQVTLGVLVPALLFSACSHKTDAKTELEKAAQALTTGSPASAEPAPAPAQPAPASAPSPELSTTPSTPAGTPAQQMRQAITAYQTGNLEDAVTRLQKLRMTVSLTPAQRMAVQDGVAAVMTEVYGMAEQGNARAIEAVKQYEMMQTTR